MSTDSRRTSFYALTRDFAVDRIEIPRFQRDYAQGREGAAVKRVRDDFLDALLTAVTGDAAASVGLDFVYGGVEGATLRPLDGQQRLTTLFLLHWYIASRSGNLTEEHGWKRFSYDTRQSARMFCERLAEHPLPEAAAPSQWITDQPWYLFLWRHDPTIRSMLVMLDGIHDRFNDIDAATAWARLTRKENPAIWFLFLPLSDLGSAAGKGTKPEDLYIKMNSRGKPLTEFENFKAQFEKTIQWSSRRDDFARKVDTTWSDLLWHLRGDDDALIDDEFLRYFEFVIEICEWRDGFTDGPSQRLVKRMQAVFGEQNPHCAEHLDFLFQALEIWESHPIAETFAAVFAGAGDAEGTSKVRLFFRADSSRKEPLNLFEGCCRAYGETRGRTRLFSLGQSLMLYAVLLHLIEGHPDFTGRARILRNLIEASTDELRPERMPRILADVDRIIRDGTIDAVETLNQAQVNDEKLKATFLVANPHVRSAVFELEDNDLLRGSLGAFELDPERFAARAAMFLRLMSQPGLWSDLLAALLAVGQYQRRRTNSRPFLFGTDSERHSSAWRELLTGPTRDALQPTRHTLAAFLDRLTESQTSPLADAMRAISQEYLVACEAEARFDWRYYMVKYPSMRENGSSTYYAEQVNESEPARMGYSLCMLQAGGRALNGYYRDPYLLAIWRELKNTTDVEDKWFIGYESTPRRLPLKRSGTSLRCVPAGFELAPPSLRTDNERFAAVCADLNSTDGLVAVPQVEVDAQRVDTVDRIQVGANIVQRLLDAGL